MCYEEVGAALYWRIFMFSYLMVLQILGIMLAFQTRRVKVKSLKDSTFVAANVYISSIVIVMFILVTFALRTYHNAYSAIFATGIFILTTTFLTLTFVPKVLLSCIYSYRLSNILMYLIDTITFIKGNVIYFFPILYSYSSELS